MNNRITALVLLLLAIGLFFTYINPTWTVDIAETKAAIEASNSALASADAYLARQEELKAERASINQDDLARLTVLLPDAVDNVGLILSLTALAQRVGFSISSIDVSGNTSSASGTGSTGANPVGSIDLNVSGTGNYTAFRNFLAGVERSQRLLDVRDIKVSGANNGSYTYQMSLRIYWLR